ncbi:MAG: alpha/beta hydrolase [Candidatus Schekmanbacteria bacterium]|nr:alpha/beta hydrolase [Candidatus Schekmanbacteria bacterium]
MISAVPRDESRYGSYEPSVDPFEDGGFDTEDELSFADEDMSSYRDEFESADLDSEDAYGLGQSDPFAGFYSELEPPAAGDTESSENPAEELEDDWWGMGGWEEQPSDEGEAHALAELSEWDGRPPSASDPDVSDAPFEGARAQASGGTDWEDAPRETVEGFAGDEEMYSIGNAPELDFPGDPFAGARANAGGPWPALRTDMLITDDQLMGALVSGQKNDNGEIIEKAILSGRDNVGVAVPFRSFDPSRTPVIYVHGVNGSPSSLEALARAAEDKDKLQPYVFFYDDDHRNLTDSGRDLAAAIAEIRELHGRALTADGQITIVAHSMGGEVALSGMRQVAASGWGDGGDGKDPRLTLVAIDTPWRGYGMGGDFVKRFVGENRSFPDMIADSTFQADLHRGPLPANMTVRLMEADNSREKEWSRKIVGFRELHHLEIDELLRAAYYSTDGSTLNQNAIRMGKVRNMAGTLDLLPEEQRLSMIRDLREIYEDANRGMIGRTGGWKKNQFRDVIDQYVRIVEGTHDSVLEKSDTIDYVRSLTNQNGQPQVGQ